MDSLQKTGSRLHSNTTTTAARALVKKAAASNQPVSLAKNEILRGLVTDLRPGIVKIHLANKQAIVAKLEGTNEVSIGDVAAFKITENDGGKLTLKKLNSTVSAEEATIQKALEEADLPTTPINHAVVKELLYHKLPINKETINMILKKTEDFPNANVDTIVYLTKQGIPLNEEYLEQLESYKQFDHRLMQHIDQIGEQFDIFLKGAALREPVDTLLSLASSVFSFLETAPISLSEYLELISAEMELEELIDESTLESTLVEEEPSIKPPSNEPGIPSNDKMLSLNGKEQKQLLKLFASYDLPEDFMLAIKTGEVSLRETIQYLSEAISYYSQNAPEELGAFRTPFVLSLWDDFSALQLENKELAGALSTSERQELVDALKDVPMTADDSLSLKNGEMTLSRFFSLVSAFVKPEYEASLRSLFAKQSFGKLVNLELTTLFSLTPEQLSEDPDSVAKFYNSLVDKMEDLTHITSLSSQTDSVPLADKMEGLQKNLDFMQDFNKLFTYVQLPMKLKEQITHGDLYVYTNKKRLQSGQKDISVLLHLDMIHLGPLDIHLSLTGTKVHSKFYLEEKETLRLMQRNVSQLSDALSKKGFQIESEFLDSPGKPDILKDIVDREEHTTPIKRYSFDIRA